MLINHPYPVIFTILLLESSMFDAVTILPEEFLGSLKYWVGYFRESLDVLMI